MVRGVAKLLFSLKVERQAPLPDPPFVIAANHYSHFDPPLLGSVVGTPMRYFALEDLFGANRLLDWLIVGYGAIPTARHHLPISAVRTGLSALDEGEVVTLFPEATRVSHWGTLSPKRGAAWLAIRAGVPLVPMAVIGTGRTLGLDNRLHRAPVGVVIGEAIDSTSRDSHDLTNEWADWMAAQIRRFPTSEVSGPRRASFEGGLEPDRGR